MPFIDIGNLFGNKKDDDTPADVAAASTTAASDVSATPSPAATAAANQTLEEYLATQPSDTPISPIASQPLVEIPAILPGAEVEASASPVMSAQPEASVITFDSTPDVEDPDKPAQVETPAVPLNPGAQVKQNGIREVKGPEFAGAVQPTSSVAQLADLDVNAQIAQLNALATPVAPVTPAAPVATPVESLADTVDGELLTQPASEPLNNDLASIQPVTPTPELAQPEVSDFSIVPPLDSVGSVAAVNVVEAALEPITIDPIKTDISAEVKPETDVASEPTQVVSETVEAVPVDPITFDEPMQIESSVPTPEVEVLPVEAVRNPVMPNEMIPAEPFTPVEAPVIPAAPVTPATPVSEVKPSMSELSSIDEKKYTLDELLNEAVARKASDLHLSPGYRPMLRIDGKLVNVSSPIIDEAKINEMVVSLVPGTDVKTTRDIDMAYQSKDGFRFRVNIFRQRHGLAIVFRVISSKIPAMDDLNLPQKIRDFTEISQGLILVTGPTGSGKSTTIASILQHINANKSKHIVTIEDPVEYLYPKGQSLIDQRNIGEDTDNWTKALRAVLRQDPDIVLVGEMRDFETIAAALTIAETGHLVFATLHTNSAAQSIDRIVDVFPEEQQQQIRTQLANVLVSVVSQRLIPVNNGGRRAAIEIMMANSAVKTAIRESKVHQIDNIIQTSAEIGMLSMEKSLVDLVRAGQISMETAQFYSNKPDEVIRLLSGGALSK